MNEMEMLREQNILRNKAKMDELNLLFGIPTIKPKEVQKRKVREKNLQPEKRSVRIEESVKRNENILKNNQNNISESFYQPDNFFDFNKSFAEEFDDDLDEDFEDDECEEEDSDFDHENGDFIMEEDDDHEEPIKLSDKKLKKINFKSEAMESAETTSNIAVQSVQPQNIKAKDEFLTINHEYKKTNLPMLERFLNNKTNIERDTKIIDMSRNKLTFSILHEYIIKNHRKHYYKISFKAMEVCVERVNVLTLNEVMDRLKYLTSTKT
jgi:hypothetical protein